MDLLALVKRMGTLLMDVKTEVKLLAKAKAAASKASI